MPRRPMFKKRATRPRKNMYRKRPRRLALARPIRSSQGFMAIWRKHAIIAVHSTAAAGVANVSDPGGGTTCVVLGTPTTSVGTVGNYYDVPFSMAFTFNQLVNSAEFATLFDQYKFKKVRVQIQCNNNVAAVASTVGGQLGYMPYLEYITDHDDGAAPVTTTFRERMGIKTRYFNASTGAITLTCYPKASIQIDSTAGTAQAVPQGKNGLWINMTDRAVLHYAIKGVFRRMYLPAGAFTQSFNVDIASNVLLKGVV